MALTSCDSLALREERLKLKGERKENINIYVVYRCSIAVLAFYTMTLGILGLFLGWGAGLRSFSQRCFLYDS